MYLFVSFFALPVTCQTVSAHAPQAGTPSNPSTFSEVDLSWLGDIFQEMMDLWYNVTFLDSNPHHKTSLWLSRWLHACGDPHVYSLGGPRLTLVVVQETVSIWASYWQPVRLSDDFCIHLRVESFEMRSLVSFESSPGLSKYVCSLSSPRVLFSNFCLLPDISRPAPIQSCCHSLKLWCRIRRTIMIYLSLRVPSW